MHMQSHIRTVNVQNVKMSWENQQMSSQIAGPFALESMQSQPQAQPQPQIVSQLQQTDAERIDSLIQKVNDLQQQIQNGAPKRPSRVRKSTLASVDAKIVSIEAKIDIILNILQHHS